MDIRLTKEEFDYATSAPFIPESFRKEIVDGTQKHSQGGVGREKVVVKVTEDTADEIRSRCEDQLSIAGFNIDYTLNSEGKILNSLLDKLFTG